jgi:hypothetical protein
MNDLLALAIQAAGGFDRWSQIQSLDVRVLLTGALFQRKAFPEGLPNITLRVDARQPAITVSPYARPDHRGYFTPDCVWIEDRAGKIVEERSHPRASYEKTRGLRGRRGISSTGCTSPATRCGTTSRRPFSSRSPASA